MEIPAKRKSTGRPLQYPFNKVELNKPFNIAVSERKIISASNAARQYAKKNNMKFEVRSSDNGITIYRTQ